MKIEMKKKKSQPRVLAVSSEAHEKIVQEAFNATPRLTVRELINQKFKLPKDL